MADKVWCTEHQRHPMDCFFEHNPTTITSVVPEYPEIIDDPVLMLVLPCHHLKRRPKGLYAVVECACGRRWRLRLEEAGKAWEASEVVS